MSRDSLLHPLQRFDGDAGAAVFPGDCLLNAASIAADLVNQTSFVKDNDEVRGIVSERDVMRAVARDGADCLGRPVGTIMTRKVITCAENDSITTIMGIMTDGRFRHVPVVKNDRLIGIISIGDVVKNHIAEVEMEANALKSYVAG